MSMDSCQATKILMVPIGVPLCVLQIGLAVGDIAEVQRSAALKRIAMQVCSWITINPLDKSFDILLLMLVRMF